MIVFEIIYFLKLLGGERSEPHLIDLFFFAKKGGTPPTHFSLEREKYHLTGLKEGAKGVKSGIFSHRRGWLDLPPA